MHGQFHFLKTVDLSAESWAASLSGVEIPSGSLCAFETPRAGTTCVCLDLPSLRHEPSGIPMPLPGMCRLSAREVLDLVMAGSICILGGDYREEDSSGVVSFLN